MILFSAIEREKANNLYTVSHVNWHLSFLEKSSKQEKTLSLRTEINNLPSPNLETVIYLFKHLRRYS